MEFLLVVMTKDEQRPGGEGGVWHKHEHEHVTHLCVRLVLVNRVALGYVIRTQGRARSASSSGGGGKSPGAAVVQQRNCAAMDQPTSVGNGLDDEPIASNTGMVFVNENMRECVVCLVGLLGLLGLPVRSCGIMTVAAARCVYN